MLQLGAFGGTYFRCASSRTLSPCRCRPACATLACVLHMVAHTRPRPNQAHRFGHQRRAAEQRVEGVPAGMVRGAGHQNARGARAGLFRTRITTCNDYRVETGADLVPGLSHVAAHSRSRGLPSVRGVWGRQGQRATHGARCHDARDETGTDARREPTHSAAVLCRRPPRGARTPRV